MKRQCKVVMLRRLNGKYYQSRITCQYWEGKWKLEYMNIKVCYCIPNTVSFHLLFRYSSGCCISDTLQWMCYWGMYLDINLGQYLDTSLGFVMRNNVSDEQSCRNLGAISLFSLQTLLDMDILFLQRISILCNYLLRTGCIWYNKAIVSKTRKVFHWFFLIFSVWLIHGYKCQIFLYYPGKFRSYWYMYILWRGFRLGLFCPWYYSSYWPRQ